MLNFWLLAGRVGNSGVVHAAVITPDLSWTAAVDEIQAGEKECPEVFYARVGICVLPLSGCLSWRFLRPCSHKKHLFRDPRYRPILPQRRRKRIRRPRCFRVQSRTVGGFRAKPIGFRSGIQLFAPLIRE